MAGHETIQSDASTDIVAAGYSNDRYRLSVGFRTVSQTTRGGRPPRLNKDKRELAIRLYNERQMPIAKICAMMGISKPTLYAYVRAADPAKAEPGAA